VIILFNVCTIEETKKRISEKFSIYELEIEEVRLIDAINRYLATDIYAKCDVPHFNRSTVDGYAILSKDSVGASESMPAFLKIKGQVLMGDVCHDNISSGEAIYVPTGGVLPEGANSVVMIEDTEILNDELFVYKKSSPRENILYLGDDIKINEKVLSKGRLITAQDLGVLSSIGYVTIKVFKKIKYTVISTGDEIVSPEAMPQIGEVRDINSYTISGSVLERNGELIDYCVVKDKENDLKEKITQALNNSDIVVISGGSSVGHKDLTYQLLNEIEENSVFVHGIAMKPGKPTIFARVNNRVVFGLPGQPASALLVFKTFISHIEQVLLNKKEELPLFYLDALLTKNVHATPGRETYQMVKIIKTAEGYFAEPIYGKSGTITLIAKANGYIKISANCEGLQANDLVKVYEL